MSRPYYDYLHRVPPGSFASGAPLSVHRVLTLRSNVQLLVDLSAQHRFNFVAPVPTESGYDTFWYGYPDGAAADTYALWQHEIEHAWQRSEWPNGIDLVVAISRSVHGTGGADVEASVRVVPASAPVNDLSVVPYYAVALETAGEGTTDEIDTRIFFSTPVEQRGAFIEHSLAEDGSFRSVRQGLARIEIALFVPENSSGGITEIYFREFVCP